MTNEETIKEIEYMKRRTIDFFEVEMDVFNKAIEALKEQDTNKWISCSERLPEEDVEVLVTQKNGFVRHALLTDFYGYGNKFVTYEEGATVCDVIAWMPLPSSFKEGGQ